MSNRTQMVSRGGSAPSYAASQMNNQGAYGSGQRAVTLVPSSPRGQEEALKAMHARYPAFLDVYSTNKALQDDQRLALQHPELVNFLRGRAFQIIEYMLPLLDLKHCEKVVDAVTQSLTALETSSVATTTLSPQSSASSKSQSSAQASRPPPAYSSYSNASSRPSSQSFDEVKMNDPPASAVNLNPTSPPHPLQFQFFQGILFGDIVEDRRDLRKTTHELFLDAMAKGDGTKQYQPLDVNQEIIVSMMAKAPPTSKRDVPDPSPTEYRCPAILYVLEKFLKVELNRDNRTRQLERIFTLLLNHPRTNLNLTKTMPAPGGDTGNTAGFGVIHLATYNVKRYSALILILDKSGPKNRDPNRGAATKKYPEIPLDINLEVTPSLSQNGSQKSYFGCTALDLAFYNLTEKKTCTSADMSVYFTVYDSLKAAGGIHKMVKEEELPPWFHDKTKRDRMSDDILKALRSDKVGGSIRGRTQSASLTGVSAGSNRIRAGRF